MIWSFLKILIFVGIVGAVTLGTGYIIEAGGEVRIAIGAIEFSLSPLAGLALLILMLVGGWIAFRIAGLLVATVRFLNGDETAISRYFDRNRERRGFEALADALMALASGEGRTAMAKAARAEKHLARPELTLLLSAQAAEQAGETKRAQDYYKRLLGDDRTRFVGVLGILKQKLAEGDTDTALGLAQKAFALKPKHEKTLDLLFTLQSEKADWKGARATLAAKLKARTLPKDVHVRRDAVLALADAREKIEAGELPAGSTAAFEANRLSPDLVPAAVLAAEMHLLNNAPKQAVKILIKAWASGPHPDLAAAFAEIEPEETPAARRTRFQPLLKMNADHPESRMLAAELALVAEDFPAARKAMGDLAETRPTTRSLTIMAAIERGEGAQDAVVRGWLTKALSASRGPQWICDNCRHIHPAWAPICGHCNSFDTLAWAEPPSGSEGPERAHDMLPLIVGALEAPGPGDGDTDDAEIVSPDRNSDLAAEVEDLSDDMDGILGDPHAVPETAAVKT